MKTPVLPAELLPEFCSLQCDENVLKLKKVRMMLSETLSSFPHAIFSINYFKTHLENKINSSPSQFEIVASSSSKEVSYLLSESSEKQFCSNLLVLTP